MTLHDIETFYQLLEETVKRYEHPAQDRKSPLHPVCGSEKSCARKAKEEFIFNAHMTGLNLTDKEKEAIKPCWHGKEMT